MQISLQLQANNNFISMMRLITIFTTLLLTAITTTTALPVSDSAANQLSTTLVPRGSTCGNVYIGYNTPVWEDQNLDSSNQCRQFSMSIFLYSVDSNCHCRFYSKPNCTSKVVDVYGPVPAQYMSQPTVSRWYVCGRV
ncbi:hypothetical protein K504DRAFT_116151 [Pleomassaria siparia CBS 279.74]|uniref:Uncharacterized protein n=1 Tax=Pleomassaria siparia CBS 279.74 TaxID=1314801 RepID=A0A6G1JVT4_9PLEO|nr:hypothetical protein K504DRAFT_116151 [Pleomassaria siparia CBS 279.74]